MTTVLSGQHAASNIFLLNMVRIRNQNFSEVGSGINTVPDPQQCTDSREDNEKNPPKSPQKCLTKKEEFKFVDRKHRLGRIGTLHPGLRTPPPPRPRSAIKGKCSSFNGLKLSRGGPWALTMEAWRLTNEPVGQWSQTCITLMRSRIRIRIKVKS